jgi:hypothetical protein
VSQIVVTLIGVNNEVAGRVRVHLQGLPDDIVALPDVSLVELEAPVIVLGVQINGVPD